MAGFILTMAALAHTGCGQDEEPARETKGEAPTTTSPTEPGPVWITPTEPTAETPITVRARTLYGQGQPGDGSNYHFNLRGPTGAECAQRFHSAVGMPAWEARSTEQKGEVVVRPYYPTRDDSIPLTPEGEGTTWCPGTYNGAVEWRTPGRGHWGKERELPSGIVIFGKLVGTYSFEIPAEE